MGMTFDRKLSLFNFIVCLLAVAVGLTVLVGWVLNIPAIKSVLPGLATMKPNTALGIMATAVALWLQAGAGSGCRAGRVAAALAVLIGAVTLAEYMGGFDFGVDEVLFRDRDTAADSHPGRMAPMTALSLMLLGTGLALLDAPRSGVLARSLAAVVAFANFLALVCYLYGAEALYRVGPFSTVAAHTAVSFFFLALGVLAARPERGVVGLLASPTLGGLVVRRQTFAALAFLLVASWARIAGERAGLFTAPFGTALMFALSVAGFALLIAATGRTLRDIDAGRRAAEAGVEAQRRLLQTTLASIGDAVIATDAAGRVTFLNPVAEALTGWSAAAAAGVPLEAVFVIVNETTRKPVENPARRALTEGVVVGLANHTILIAKDGVERPIDDSAAPIRDEAGRVGGCVLVFRDISERHRRDRELRDRERQFGTLAEAIPHLAWIADPDGHIFWYNRRWFEYTGTTLEQMAGWGWQAVHDPDVLPKVLERWQASVAAAQPFDMVFPLRRRDGVFRPFLTRVEPVLDPEGRVARWFGTNTDIADRERAELLLADQNRVLQQMLRGGPLAEVLEALCRSAEDHTAEGSIATVLLMDADGTLLRPAAGGRCPAAYSDAINPVQVGPSCGSCGTAAHRGQPVIVADIAADPLWADYRAAALSHGLRSCWSLPIPSSSGAVLGTFAVYSPAPRRPADQDLRVIELLARTAGLAIERRRAEEAVRESRERLQAALDGSGSGTFRWDIQTDALDWDENLDRLFGLAPGKTIRSLEKFVATIHPDDQPDVVERCRRCADEGVDFSMEFRVVWPDGSVHWLDDQGKTFRDDAGRPYYMTGMCRDITQRRRDEQVRRDGEERLRMALTAARMVAWQLEPASGGLALSDTAADVFGLPFGTTMDRAEQGFGLVHPDDVEQHRAVVMKAAEECGSFVTQFRVVRPDTGAVIWLEDRGHATRPVAGGSVRLDGVMIDITERRRTEERLRASEERFRTLIEQVKEHAIFGTDTEGRATTWNEGVRRVLGFEEADFIGQDIVPAIFTPEDVRDGVAQRELDEAAAKGSSSNDRWMVRKDGTRFWAAGITTGRRDEGGRAVGFTKVMRDMTAQKELEDELRRLAADLSEADHRKNEFLATLAHELRNPLAPIRNGLQIIGLSGPNGAVEKARTMMERQLTQLVRLVDDLLDVSRITRNKLELRRERVEVRAVIDSAVETARPQVEQAGHELVVAVPGELLPVDGDATRLAQVVSNLLTNSAKYTHRGGHIRLSVTRDDAAVVISVADDGIGIPPDMLGRVFEMFTQVDRTLEKTTGGLGIGLSLVKGLVEAHGGTVKARSDGEGRGSEFVVRLPLVASATSEPGRAATPAEPLKKSARRVLVVDDNVDGAESMAQLLELLGNEVRKAHDGEAGVAAAAAFRPDVVLCDIGMPRLNGYEAARRIREQPWGRTTVLVALTGWGQDEDRRRSSDAGFDLHLVKPVDLAALMKMMAGLTPASG